MPWTARLPGTLRGLLAPFLCLFCLWRSLLGHLKPNGAVVRHRAERKPVHATAQNTSPSTRFQPKPPWVLREVIRLKALMPADTGCRSISEQFNRMHGSKRDGATVGRTWVAENLKKHRYRVLRLRRHLKHRRPRPMPAHRIWAMDMTGVPDTNGRSETVIGIIDHGSRWLLRLQRTKTKSSIALLRTLLDTIEAHDFHKPGRLRTDNEAVFTSRVFRFGLVWLGIRHQRTDMGCPWQNGRIERLFGTLKAKSQGLLFEAGALPEQLGLFRFWYNHVRTHQHLDGRTPCEALNRLPAQWITDATGEPEWFEAWHGRMAGYWFPPG